MTPKVQPNTGGGGGGGGEEGFFRDLVISTLLVYRPLRRAIMYKNIVTKHWAFHMFDYDDEDVDDVSLTLSS